MVKNIMSLLENKRVVILGLGNHGGGITSTQFAVHSKAKHIFISDTKEKSELSHAFSVLKPLLARDNVDIETTKHSLSKIEKADCIIKNPAIPHHTKVISHLRKTGASFETDISLFLKKIAPDNCTVYAITGTKGKSSLSTALHNWNIHQNISSSLLGNISYSPLKLLMNKEKKDHYVLELSSFQIGDFRLVKDMPYTPIQVAVLTNILPDHQNYYKSIQNYINDKLFLFQNVSQNSHMVLPRDAFFDETCKNAFYACAEKTKAQVWWHAMRELEPHVVGVWCNLHNSTTTEQGIFVRTVAHAQPTKICNISDLPALVLKENITIFIASCLAKQALCNNKTSSSMPLQIPQTKEEWENVFSLAHRKEYLGIYKNRLFYNDSAATIPQAMQLKQFDSVASENINLHIICGGTDKNLHSHDFIHACAELDFTKTQLYLLEGSYTQKIIPELQKNSISFNGVFTSLQDSLDCALEKSKEGDIIILSPGCASFEMFEHEFDRGDTFRKLVKALKS